MRVCVICEGCYPFIQGGVSSWLNSLMEKTPEHEYIVWAIGAETMPPEDYKVKNIPPNVIEIRTIFLDEMLRSTIPKWSRRNRLTPAQEEAVAALLSCKAPDWREIFALFAGKEGFGTSLLNSPIFLDQVKLLSEERYAFVCFNDLFWSVRSMFLPLLYLLGQPVPEADLYHAVSAGYAGVLGAMAATLMHKPYVLTEHGIYTREREEEIIRSDWVQQHFKDMWIKMFHMLTLCAYGAADRVTSLFRRASLIQQEIGCPAEKCSVVPNGINLPKFTAIPPKKPDTGLCIAAIVRIVPIKDIKTMLYAFSLVKSVRDDVSLLILGPETEDEEYHRECLNLVTYLGLKDVEFTGSVPTDEYLEKADFTLLTSISEGQPLAILEAMAARRPVVTTDVGSCRELIEGVDDGFGPAGFCVPVMHQTALAEAILQMCENERARKQMGESGFKRATELFGHPRMVERYQQAYAEAIQSAQQKWKET